VTHRTTLIICVLHRNTTYTIIRIKRAFLDILENHEDYVDFYSGRYIKLFVDIENMAGIPASRQAPISPESAIYRTHCALATVILHEFVHAFLRAYFEVPNRATTKDPTEPWAPGDRSNEQGWAFENFVFGGVVKPMKIFIPPMSDEYNVIQSALAPFGSYTTWQWDVWLGNKAGNWKTMDSDWTGLTEEDLEPTRHYPVPQAWTQWLFSDDLWTNHVLRFGLEAIKVPKIYEWQVVSHAYGRLGMNETGEERWNTGENMDERDWECWLPAWDVFDMEGIPEEEQIYKGPKWEP